MTAVTAPLPWCRYVRPRCASVVPRKGRLQLLRTPALAGPGWLLPGRRRRCCRVAPELSLPICAIATAAEPRAGSGQCLGGHRWSTWRSLHPSFYLPRPSVLWSPTAVSQWWPTAEAMGCFPAALCFDSLATVGEPRSHPVTSVQMRHADLIGPVSCERVCVLLLTEPCRSILTRSCALSMT